VLEPFTPGVAARFSPVPLTRSVTCLPLAARTRIDPPFGTAKSAARPLAASARTSPGPGSRPESTGTVLTGADARAPPAISTFWLPPGAVAVVR